jgi:hypothetical protein
MLCTVNPEPYEYIKSDICFLFPISIHLTVHAWFEGLSALWCDSSFSSSSSFDFPVGKLSLRNKC